MNILPLFSLASSLVYFAMAVFVLRLDVRSRTNKAFFLLCLCLAWWAFFYTFVYNAPDNVTAIRWFKVSSIGRCIFASVALHFILLLTKKERMLKRPWIYALLYIPPLAFIYQTWTGIVTAKDFIYGPLGWTEVIDFKSPWFSFYLLYMTGTLIAGLIIAWLWGIVSPLEREKAQARMICYGLYILIILGVTGDIIFSELKPQFLPSIAHITSSAMAFTVYHAIKRYRLMTTPFKAGVDNLLSTMRELLILIDHELNIIQVNYQVEVLTGYYEDELLKRQVNTILLEEEIIKNAFSTLREFTHSFYTHNVTLKTKNGEHLPINITCSTLRGVTGQIEGLLIIGHDMRQMLTLYDEIIVRKRTEDALLKTQNELERLLSEKAEALKRANERLSSEIELKKGMEERLSELEERLHLILDGLDEAVLLKDLEGSLIGANEEALQLTGYKREELVGMDFFRLLPPSSHTEYRHYLEGLIQEGTGYSGGLEVSKKDGTFISVEIEGRVIERRGTKIIREVLRDQRQAERRGTPYEMNDKEWQKYLIKQKDPVFLADIDGVLLEANAPFMRLFGYSEKGIKGLVVEDLFNSPEEWGMLKEEVVLKGFEVKEEVVLRDYNKNELTCLLVIFQRLDNVRGMKGYWGIVRDLTWKNKIVKAVIESEKRLRAMFDNETDAIFIIKDDMCVDSNLKALDLSGLKRDEINGQPFYKIFSNLPCVPADLANDQSGLTSLMDKALEGGPQKLVWRHTGLNDKTADMEMEISRLEINGLQIMQVTIRDITEIKAKEERLKRERERFWRLLEHIPLGIIMADKDGNNIYINRRFTELFGYLKEDIPDIKAWVQSLSTDTGYDSDILHNHISPFREGDGIGRPEVSILICKDGSEKMVSFIVIPLNEAEYIFIIEDISELKQLENEMRSLFLTEELTGLYSRKGFNVLAEQQMKLADRMGHNMALIFIDLDNLKWINATFGYHEGNRALMDLACVLKESFRKSDIIARIGEDEFIVLPILDKYNTMVIIERMLENLSKHNRMANRGYNLSISIGVSYYNPKSSTTLDELIDTANRLMYQQKRQKQKEIIKDPYSSSL